MCRAVLFTFTPRPPQGYTLHVPTLKGAMEFDLCSGILLRSGTFNALVAPEELATRVIAGREEFERFGFLYVGGPSARLHPKTPAGFLQFDVRTARTADELKSILESACHTIIFVEHDPAWYDPDEQAFSAITHELTARAKNALVILYTHEPDRTFEILCRKADRVFFFNALPVPACHGARRQHRVPGNGRASAGTPIQRMLEEC
ncbi:MAG: hypothetical protein NTZ39_04095 [Methanoregula sp.]|nr:hypothetical protein [Methanoregula sp.]